MSENIEKEMSFEEALAVLEASAAKLRSGHLGLEDSVKEYEKCVEYHRICSMILDNMKQKIEIYRPETGKVEDFGEY